MDEEKKITINSILRYLATKGMLMLRGLFYLLTISGGGKGEWRNDVLTHTRPHPRYQPHTRRLKLSPHHVRIMLNCFSCYIHTKHLYTSFLLV